MAAFSQQLEGSAVRQINERCTPVGRVGRVAGAPHGSALIMGYSGTDHSRPDRDRSSQVR